MKHCNCRTDSGFPNLRCLQVQWGDGFTVLHWAAKNGRADLLQHCLGLRADPDVRG